MNHTYEKYNREERNLCSHLFRLLLMDHPNYGPLKEFVGDEDVSGPRIFSEVALIRDAYYKRNDKIEFMDDICGVIANQENLKDYRVYSSLIKENELFNRTYPSFIKLVAKKNGIQLSKDELKLYGAVQGMFKAKPDLVICYSNNLLIYEAKYTLDFDTAQLKRTAKIGEVWSKLLYHDLGFTDIPKIKVLKLGLKKYNPHVSWTDIFDIAQRYLIQGDISLRAIEYGANWKN